MRFFRRRKPRQALYRGNSLSQCGGPSNFGIELRSLIHGCCRARFASGFASPSYTSSLDVTGRGEPMSHRRTILDWSERGLITDVCAALELGGALPAARDWRAFLDRLLLWSGAVALAAAVVFFIAHNSRQVRPSSRSWRCSSLSR
jgi:hypothetical protein